MPRTAPVMSSTDLRAVLSRLAKERDFEEDYGPIDPLHPDLDRVLFELLDTDAGKAVVDDWAKVDVSWENLDVEAERTTAQGIPYLECFIGGDWETPLLAIVYFDGKKLRGYIPKDGNSYNHKAKAAFGNNDTDIHAAHQQTGRHFPNDGTPIELSPDPILTRAAIETRLMANGTYTPSTQPTVSRAAQKAVRQARQEQGLDLSGPITADMVYVVIHLAAGGSYLHLELRASRRAITREEGRRVVGLPSSLRFQDQGLGEEALWYTPAEIYPKQALRLIEQAGFTKAPDNDVDVYGDPRTIVIRI